jgi:polyisoprenyl-phosphate glycosyltransferase
MGKKLISIMVPTYNEEENVAPLYKAVKEITGKISRYDFEFVFIDNASTDKTVAILKELAQKDKNLKVIVNVKNFGHIRSPYYGLLNTNGDATIYLVCDFQDPLEMIPKFIEGWENGHDIVIGIKDKSKENPLMFMVRKLFYYISGKISETEYIKNFTGFGLYDKRFIDVLRSLDEPYPYFRGLVAMFGSNILRIPYVQPRRKAGKTKNNFYTLYDIAMLGFVNHSKIPIRLASFIGFAVAFLSFCAGVGYFVYKVLHWNTFEAGIAPLVIGFFFFTSIQLFFIGIIGEYISSIYTKVQNHPLVVEKERINF